MELGRSQERGGQSCGLASGPCRERDGNAGLRVAHVLQPGPSCISLLGWNHIVRITWSCSFLFCVHHVLGATHALGNGPGQGPHIPCLWLRGVRPKPPSPQPPVPPLVTITTGAPCSTLSPLVYQSRPRPMTRLPVWP